MDSPLPHSLPHSLPHASPHPSPRPSPSPRSLPAPLGLPAPLNLPLLRATALELVVLLGHLLLYPTGLAAERVPGRVPERVPEDAQAATLPAPATPAPAVPVLPSKRRPVILLHGFIDNRSVFVLLRRLLAPHGRAQLSTLNYSPLTCDIRSAAELLGRHVERVCARTGAREVDLVGHSLGGLIARYYVQRCGGDLRVRTLVTLGTPHSGTAFAPRADLHPIVRQMRPGSAVLTELRSPATHCRTRFVSFWSDLDRVMDPPEAARIDHPDLIARNVRVTGIGHLTLPVHPTVAYAVREALAQEAEAAEAAETTGVAGVTGAAGATGIPKRAKRAEAAAG